MKNINELHQIAEIKSRGHAQKIMRKITIEELGELEKKVTATYSAVNTFMSGCHIPLADLAYPQHDGVLDANAVGNIMYLLASVNSLSKACDIFSDELTKIIELTQNSEEQK